MLLYTYNYNSVEDLVTTKFADLHYAGKAKFFYVEGKDDGFELMWTVNEEENNNEKIIWNRNQWNTRRNHIIINNI